VHVIVLVSTKCLFAELHCAEFRVKNTVYVLFLNHGTFEPSFDKVRALKPFLELDHFFEQKIEDLFILAVESVVKRTLACEIFKKRKLFVLRVEATR
jgi:hypothetical protein